MTMITNSSSVPYSIGSAFEGLVNTDWEVGDPRFYRRVAQYGFT